jgi:hypothetical protein
VATFRFMIPPAPSVTTLIIYLCLYLIGLGVDSLSWEPQIAHRIIGNLDQLHYKFFLTLYLNFFILF